MTLMRAKNALFFALILDSGGAVNNKWHLLLKTLLWLTDHSQNVLLQSSYRDKMVPVSCLAE
jgi:hypothetical protein